MGGQLGGKVAIITGGARGMGEAEVRLFAAQGATVVFGDVLDAEGEALARAVPGATYVHLDVSREDQWAAAVKLTLERHGRIDVLVNNAGINRQRPALDYSEAEYDAIVDVNLKGVFFLSTAVARTMRAAGRAGSIITITSQAGVVGAPGRSIYSAAKAGAAHLMRTLAAEWAPYGIRCNAIAPTFTRTPLLEAALAVNPAFAASTATVPLGRIAEPADIAGAVVFLASPAAAMITGQHLAVDGGFTAI